MDNSKTTTFWKYLKDNNIVIPIIQRDYAQGRIGKEYLRENFDSLLRVYNLLSDERSRTCFEKLIEYRITGEISCLKSCESDPSEAVGILSFGMTHAYRIAVSMGADIVRIGTLIFGERTY